MNARHAHGALIAALFMVSLLGALNVTIISASLATIVGDLGALEHIAWAVTSYTLAATIAMPVIGQLGDMWGRRNVMLGSLAVFILGSIACGFADSMASLTLLRAVAGVGSAGIGLLPQTVIADVFPPRERAKWASLLASVFGIATVLGPALGGAITDLVGWRWIFFINAPLGLVAFALAWRSLPRNGPRHPARMDYAGATLLGLVLTGLTLLVTLVGTAWPWGSPAAIATVTITAAALATFLRVEARAASPIVPLVMFRERGVVAALALGIVSGGGMLSLVSYLPAYAQMRYNTSTVIAGAVPIGITVGLIVSSNLVGHLISRTGRYYAYPIAGTALGAAALAVSAATLDSLTLPLLATMFFLVGLGTGAFIQLAVVLIQNGAPRRYLGVATSTTNLVRQISVTLGTAMAGAALGATLTRSLADTTLPGGTEAASLTPAILAAATPAVQAEIAAAYISAMRPILVVVAAVYVLGVVAALALPRTMLEERDQPTPVPSDAKERA